jgi:phosphoenolpyruvate carboxykinase (GTP)
LKGLDISDEQMTELFKIDPEEWKKEIVDIELFYEKFGRKIPKELKQVLQALKKKFVG